MTLQTILKRLTDIDRQIQLMITDVGMDDDYALVLDAMF